MSTGEFNQKTPRHSRESGNPDGRSDAYAFVRNAGSAIFYNYMILLILLRIDRLAVQG